MADKVTYGHTRSILRPTVYCRAFIFRPTPLRRLSVSFPHVYTYPRRKEEARSGGGGDRKQGGVLA